MSAGFCGDATCALRVRFFILEPGTPDVWDPCPACLRALASAVGVATEGPLTLVSVYEAAGGRG